MFVLFVTGINPSNNSTACKQHLHHHGTFNLYTLSIDRGLVGWPSRFNEVFYFTHPNDNDNLIHQCENKVVGSTSERRSDVFQTGRTLSVG